MRIVVRGLPAPQGSKSFKGFAKSTGRAILTESSKRVKPWRQDVVAAAIDARAGAVPMDGPLVARMVFTMPKPKAAPKRKRTWPDRTPDLSKLVRSTEDALVTAGVIADDARIVEYSRVAKVFAGEDREALDSCGVIIEIEEMRCEQALQKVQHDQASLGLLEKQGNQPRTAVQLQGLQARA